VIDPLQIKEKKSERKRVFSKVSQQAGKNGMRREYNNHEK